MKFLKDVAKAFTRPVDLAAAIITGNPLYTVVSQAVTGKSLTDNAVTTLSTLKNNIIPTIPIHISSDPFNVNLSPLDVNFNLPNPVNQGTDIAATVLSYITKAPERFDNYDKFLKMTQSRFSGVPRIDLNQDRVVVRARFFEKMPGLPIANSLLNTNEKTTDEARIIVECEIKAAANDLADQLLLMPKIIGTGMIDKRNRWRKLIAQAASAGLDLNVGEDGKRRAFMETYFLEPATIIELPINFNENTLRNAIGASFFAEIHIPIIRTDTDVKFDRFILTIEKENEFETEVLSYYDSGLLPWDGNVNAAGVCKDYLGIDAPVPNKAFFKCVMPLDLRNHRPDAAAIALPNIHNELNQLLGIYPEFVKAFNAPLVVPPLIPPIADNGKSLYDLFSKLVSMEYGFISNISHTTNKINRITKYFGFSTCDANLTYGIRIKNTLNKMIKFKLVSSFRNGSTAYMRDGDLTESVYDDIRIPPGGVFQITIFAPAPSIEIPGSENHLTSVKLNITATGLTADDISPVVERIVFNGTQTIPISGEYLSADVAGTYSVRTNWLLENRSKLI